MSIGGSYVLGSGVELPARFQKADKTLTDPTIVRLRIIDPTGAAVTHIYAVGSGLITRDSAGLYRAQIVPSIPGRWHYRWEGFGVLNAAAEGAFNVPASPFYGG